MKKKIAIALSLMLLTTMCFAEMGFATDGSDDTAVESTSVSDESQSLESEIGETDNELGGDDNKDIQNPYKAPEYPSDVMLEIYCGDSDEAVKKFTRGDIDNMELVTNTYTYYNTFPTTVTAQESGVKIEDLLKEAGVWDELEGNQLIKFVGSDGVDFSMTKEKLFAPRYYFPNGDSLGPYNDGRMVDEATCEGAVKVPPIIDVGNEDSRGIVVFGQLFPGEQNKSRFCQNVIHCNKVRRNYGTTEAPDYKWVATTCGKIIITDDFATEAPVVKCKTDLPAGAKLPIGTKIEFQAPISNRGHWQFYTLDGSEPGPGSYLYNYSEYNGDNREITIQPGKNTIKIMNFSYDYLDSPTATYTFEGVSSTKYVAMPKISKLSPGKKKIKLYWNRISGAKGYKIYRATSRNGKYKCIKTVKSYKTTSYTSRSLKKGRTYYYKVRSYKVVKGKTYYSTYSPVRSAKSK